MYNGPTPPIGTHRYFVALFQQTGPGLVVDAPKSRCKFDVDAFAAQHDLTRKTDIVFKVSVRYTTSQRCSLVSYCSIYVFHDILAVPLRLASTHIEGAAQAP